MNILGGHESYNTPAKKWCRWWRSSNEMPPYTTLNIYTLYIWSDHYARKGAGWRLFDHKKGPVVAGFFCWPFFIFLLLFVTSFIACNFCKLLFIVEGSLFVTFFIACNFHKLVFTVERGKGNYFIIFIHCSGEGVRLDFFFLISFTLEREGGTR
jgi:hypothetical protein